MKKKWINRELDDKFFKEAGLFTDPEKIEKRLDEIPRSWLNEASFLLGVMRATEDLGGSDGLSCERMANIVMKADKEQVDKELHIPHYWMDRPILEPEFVVRVTNGLIGWTTDESCKDCMRKDECRIYRLEGRPDE